MNTIKNKEKLISYFHDILGENSVRSYVSMSEYTTFRAGGNTELLLIVKNEKQLSVVLQKLKEEGVEIMILGAGSNILVRDGGFSGAFVKLSGDFTEIKKNGEEFVAGAGLKLSAACAFARDNSLSGLEFACGIPGSVGGGVFMNAGAYEGQLADIVSKVRLMSKDGKEVFELSNEEMEFSYRNSKVQKSGEVVLSVTFSLKIGEKEEISSKMAELMNRRNTKQPVSIPSAGSFFKRPENGYASKLIEDAGLKGLSVGDAQVSTLHSGFIVNTGKASASDILELMKKVQNIVKEKFDVMLYPEVRIVGKD